MKKWIIPVVIWTILLICFISSINSMRIAKTLMNNFHDVATITTMKERQQAADFAKAYVSEWATWDPKEEYDARAARLKVFNEFINSDDVMQQVNAPYFPTSVAVVKCDKVGQAYCVDVMVNNAQGKALCFETNIGLNKGYPYAETLPALVPVPVIAIPPDSKFQNSTDEETKIFVQRFLESYLGGTGPADTSIYTEPGVEIRPVGGANLVSVTNVVSNTTGSNPGTVQASYLVKDQGAVFRQVITLNLKWNNGKPLVTSIHP